MKLSSIDLCVIFDCTTATIYRWRRNNGLAYEKKGDRGDPYSFDYDDVVNFTANCPMPFKALLLSTYQEDVDLMDKLLNDVIAKDPIIPFGIIDHFLYQTRSASAWGLEGAIATDKGSSKRLGGIRLSEFIRFLIEHPEIHCRLYRSRVVFHTRQLSTLWDIIWSETKKGLDISDTKFPVKELMQILGITRSSLYAYMHNYGIDSEKGFRSKYITASELLRLMHKSKHFLNRFLNANHKETEELRHDILELYISTYGPYNGVSHFYDGSSWRIITTKNFRGRKTLPG